MHDRSPSELTARRWIEPAPVSVPDALRARVGGHPLLAQTLARRGYTDPDRALAFLDPDAYTPAHPTDLPGLVRGCRRIEAAIAAKERILVWGDFDVDGQTATALLVSILQDLGADATYHVPIRAEESHGLNLPVLRRLLEDGPRLLITCDTGISDVEPIAFAHEQGLDVIVTDHHELPEVLPPALAILNPKLLPEDHPLRELSGAGVAYELAQELCRRAGRPGEEERHLDLVALGLVADLAVQTGDVRYLTQRGLRALRESGRIGLRALMEVAQVEQSRLTESHISFALAPRLNAVGRLADANVAVELLTTSDLSQARVIANELEGLNARRQLLCEQVFQAAQAQIEADPSLLEAAALVLDHPAWPAGVIGIVASRLVERYHRPTVLIAAPEGELARGSARSIEGCNITEAIAEQAHLLAGFGGHPMAAGLTIEPDRIPAFRRGLAATVLRLVGRLEGPPPLAVDGYLPLADLTPQLVDDIERLAPFGPGNPPLTLATRGVTLRSQAALGRAGEHLQLYVQDQAGTVRRVLWWSGAGFPLPDGPFDLAYTVRASDYRGLREVQIEWVDYRPAQGAHRRRPPIEVVDLRPYQDPAGVLAALRQQEEVQVWAEVEGPQGSVARDGLQPSSRLAIWTVPPGPEELEQALRSVSPTKVFLFARDPGTDEPTAFLHRLAGLVRYALRARQGRATLVGLAAATAQRESTVRLGLAWLAAHGDVVVAEQDGELRLSNGTGKAQHHLPQVEASLRDLLRETRAWRQYYRSAAAEGLVGES
ncbi:MAG: single-stranded-DNA-specific exonuclease RecJ [Anaerolineae bacterium]|nr:single-stranded-DNA-specific exonuclease RecJ [Anaerolineae bacterium]